jgi:hypothetical protein
VHDCQDDRVGSVQRYRRRQSSTHGPTNTKPYGPSMQSGGQHCNERMEVKATFKYTIQNSL